MNPRIAAGFSARLSDPKSPMPRYFFDESDGEMRHDHYGLEISDLREARREALRIASRVLENIAIDDPHATAHVSVRDETGNVQIILRLTCSKPGG